MYYWTNLENTRYNSKLQQTNNSKPNKITIFTWRRSQWWALPGRRIRRCCRCREPPSLDLRRRAFLQLRWWGWWLWQQLWGIVDTITNDIIIGPVCSPCVNILYVPALCSHFVCCHPVYRSVLTFYMFLPALCSHFVCPRPVLTFYMFLPCVHILYVLAL